MLQRVVLQPVYIVLKINMKMSHRGQSLTEILVALAIGVAFINVGIMAMATSNIVAKVNRANNFALSLLKSQREVIKTIADNGWHSIADLTIGKHYKLAKQNNSLIIQPGEEKVFDEKPPVAQWNFDEGTGATAYDNVGTNNGALISSPTWQTSSNCVNGSCLGFNGSSSYIAIGNNISLNVTNAITLEGWINLNGSPTTSQMLVEKSGQVSYWLYVTSTGTLKGGVYTGGNWKEVTNGGTVSSNTWHHIAMIYDGNQVQLWMDGSQSGSSLSATGNINTDTSDVWIGRYSGYYFNGLIDSVNIYDYALNVGQIKQHYNAGLNRLGLVSQWGMDEGSGITAYDSQGANDGTLTNFATPATSWQASSNCVIGGCLSFDGVDDYVLKTGYTHSFPAISLSAWFKTSQATNGGIVGVQYSPLLIISGGRITFYDGGTLTSPTSPLYNNNTWHYVVGTQNGTTGNIYVDGQIVATNVTSITYPYQGIYIGNNPNNVNLFFGGFIDDVRIYNRALSADEIANQYKDGYTKYFYVNNVSRDIASDPTVSTHDLESVYNANHDDPNTKKIVNVTRYLLGTPGRVNIQEQYLARATNINSLIQANWSGNSGVNGPEIDFGNNYSNASNLTLSTAGQMSLTSAASNGTLTSTIIDTQSINGSGYFNLLWQGNSLCTGCSVKFQIAASNSNSGPWTYYGPTATSDYYIPSGPGIPVPITYAGQYSTLSASVQNKRYIRYQITLVPASSVSPVVKDVIINYSP
jgi:hypothetical protein